MGKEILGFGCGGESGEEAAASKGAEVRAGLRKGRHVSFFGF